MSVLQLQNGQTIPLDQNVTGSTYFGTSAPPTVLGRFWHNGTALFVWTGSAWAQIGGAGDVMESDWGSNNTVLVRNNVGTMTDLVANTNQILGNRGSGIAALTAANVRTIINVEDGADVTDATNVNAAGAVMDSDFTAADNLQIGTGVSTYAEITPANYSDKLYHLLHIGAGYDANSSATAQFLKGYSRYVATAPADAVIPVMRAGSIRAMQWTIKVTAALGSPAILLRLYINGVATVLETTAAVSASGTPYQFGPYTYSRGTHTFAAGDIIGFRRDRSGGSSMTTSYMIGVALVEYDPV